MSSGRTSQRTARRTAGLLLLAPSLLGTTVFLLVPVAVALWLSLQRWDLVSPPTWAGLDNYAAIAADPAVRRSLVTTVLFTALVIPVQTALGLASALLLDRRLPGSAVFRVTFVVPWVSAPLVVGLVWRWVLDPSTGALNALTGVRVEWLTSPALALPAVAFVTVWTHVGYVALFYLAGLAAIPQELGDAARIDGAGAWRRFWSITLPLLRPTTSFVLVTGIIASFQVFDTVYAMTRGGPGGATQVIAYQIYAEAFTALRMGRAAALSVVLLVVMVALTVSLRWWFARRSTYEMVV
ncbi:carbohydrate ABC transporter membrane protein 1, CUT1 family [Quadrisphaera granulorum]|uniref:Carbohydrate ABC transporter membrane protein 1 (CUT1 family) n=1 Tax=Quadrisphaera granulorum TaxID=317664 RepID=A0A315ZRY2_9ACTN|nr:sugar ABC transporter permease [Quadrisphaera granulorum]PWJ48311.1 carbohydrate ABC transporter membrane protein 1 (CUT1 family) [Quadrisphaera granulorum]SZE98472.1 carbohydrate ABC transporter membrane protein 1, CUT1 family [Quadrisphaera granulorum]